VVALVEVRPGTTKEVSGSFLVGLNGEFTSQISVDSSAEQLADEINKFTSLEGIADITRYNLINNGVMYKVEFATIDGNVNEMIVGNTKC
jgi:hypothetical protein